MSLLRVGRMTNYLKQPYYFWGIGILVIVVIGYLFYRSGGLYQPPAPQPTQETTEAGLLLAGADAVNAINQPPGESVIVDLAVFSQPGYVVIHRENEEGKPGEVIGSSELLSGENGSVEIALTEEVSAGDGLFAMLHTDDGDGEYGFPETDPPTTDDEGNIVLIRFEIAEAEEGAPTPIISY